MLRLAICALFPAFCLAAAADEAKGRTSSYRERMEQLMRIDRIWDRAVELKPRRLDGPLRELNITDNEVREIQVVAGRFGMGTMLNISPVIAGCPCEEGPLCTDQVYVVATLPDRTVGLQLSRIRNSWEVGAVQKWWLRHAELMKKKDEVLYRAYETVEDQLLLEFPVCTLKSDKQASVTASQARDDTTE